MAIGKIRQFFSQRECTYRFYHSAPLVRFRSLFKDPAPPPSMIKVLFEWPFWSDFQISQSFIVENSKQCINCNTESVTNVTFQKVGTNCGIFKQALENSPNEFRSICGSKDVAMRKY